MCSHFYTTINYDFNTIMGHKILVIIPVILSIGILLALPSVEGVFESQDITIQKKDLSYSLEHLTENQLQECESLYEDYTTLEENVFNQRYLYHNFVGNCVMLFDDPVWETQGDDRYDKLSDRLSILVTLREAERIQDRSQVMFIDIKSITELQIEGTYLVMFEGCSGHRYVNMDDIVISSDTEVLQAVAPGTEGSRVIGPGRCGTGEIQIRADNPDSIKVMVTSMAIEQVMAMGGFTLMSPRDQMEHGTDAIAVVCKEGLQLMMKSSDGSAACVKATSVDRLTERGWGTLHI